MKSNDVSDAENSFNPPRPDKAGKYSDLEEDKSFLAAKDRPRDDLNLLILLQSPGLRRLGQGIEQGIQYLPLFKDFFCIVRPNTTWNRLAAARHGAAFVFLFYLLPMMFFTAVIEGRGLMLFGLQQVAEGKNNRFTLARVLVYEVGSAVVTLALIVLVAAFIKSFANACHSRNNFKQCLNVMFYSVGPMFLIQWFNGFPNMYFWLTWLIGASLTLCALYHGLPRIMEPDPPSAMGLYVGSALTVFLLLLGGRILTGYYLAGNFRTLEAWLTSAAGKFM